LLKSSRLELINITIETPTNITTLDFSLKGFMDLSCTGEKVKVVKFSFCNSLIMKPTFNFLGLMVRKRRAIL
jgi:hypothetical protein